MHSFAPHAVQPKPQNRVTVDGHSLWTERLTERRWSRDKGTEAIQTGKVWNCSGQNYLNLASNGFVSAVGLAYNQHLPLSLSPDAVWSVIAHGFSIWINENAEKVRHKFVEHQGKVKLIVEIPGWEASNPNWNRILGEFSEKIAQHIGKQRNLFINEFSTTTVDTRIGSEALLMYGMAQYFEYGMRTLCGFSKITLEGNPEDWEKISDRVKCLSGYVIGEDDQLKLWLNKLIPVTEQFVAASKGNPDLSFWRSFYKEDGGSGGPYIDGYLINLFPYFSNSKQNFVANKFLEKRGFGGPTISSFPNSYSPVDVKWEDNGITREMKFYGGVVGASLKDNTVRPEVGWAIVETSRKEE